MTLSHHTYLTSLWHTIKGSDIFESFNEYSYDFVFEKFSDKVTGDKFINHQESTAVYLGPGRPVLHVWGMANYKHRAVGINYKMAEVQQEMTNERNRAKFRVTLTALQWQETKKEDWLVCTEEVNFCFLLSSKDDF